MKVQDWREPLDATRHPLSGLTDRVIACAIEVHKTLGPGFEEVFYQRALQSARP
ncbi:MAG: hypothetical protein HYX78_16055 [Armatimonadetes bacterium]|nr:hypothetical protein [Armatimonadota bacterium]